MNQEFSSKQLKSILEQISIWAEEHGFSQVGVSDIDLNEAESHLKSWLKKGFHADMDYMHKHGSKRTHPEQLVDGTIRVLSFRMDYFDKTSISYEDVLSDSNKVYQYIKQRYNEDKIVVLGYSLGSGLATYVASKNKPKMLILNAPYYSWKTLIADEIAPPIPQYLLKYDIPTYQFIKHVTCPINVYYGTRDFLIHPDTNAKKLKEIAPSNISLHPITDGGHNGLHITKQYYDELKKIL